MKNKLTLNGTIIGIEVAMKNLNNLRYSSLKELEKEIGLEISKCDNARNDISHYIESTKSINAKEKVETYDLLHDISNRRRELKHMLQVINPLLDLAKYKDKCKRRKIDEDIAIVDRAVEKTKSNIEMVLSEYQYVVRELKNNYGEVISKER